MKNDITSRYIVCEVDYNIYTVISVSALLSSSKLVISELPRKTLKKSQNMTSIELSIIKRNLKKLGKEKLSDKIKIL